VTWQYKKLLKRNFLFGALNFERRMKKNFFFLKKNPSYGESLFVFNTFSFSTSISKKNVSIFLMILFPRMMSGNLYFSNRNANIIKENIDWGKKVSGFHPSTWLVLYHVWWRQGKTRCQKRPFFVDQSQEHMG
jgi:hypothetical protein